MINKFLLPIEYNQRSEYAYSIARTLAQRCHATIDVLHITPSSGDLSEDDSHKIAKDLPMKQLQNWASDKDYIGKLSYQSGNVNKLIQQYASENQIDLIVMGTQGLYDKRLLREPSHTLWFVEHSDIPVLSLKCDRSDIDFDEILLVSDFEDIKYTNLRVVKNIQEAFDSTLVLLKVITAKSKVNHTDEFIRIKEWATINDIKNYEISMLNAESVETGIGRFSAERDIDLIAIRTMEHRSFFSFIKRSLAQEIVNNLYHPILTIPI